MEIAQYLLNLINAYELKGIKPSKIYLSCDTHERLLDCYRDSIPNMATDQQIQYFATIPVFVLQNAFGLVDVV